MNASSSSLSEHLAQFAGKPVALFDAGAPFDFSAKVPRLALDWEAHVDGLGMAELMAELVRRPHSNDLEGLVFGVWDFIGSVNSSAVVKSLVDARERFAGLRSLFIGDIVEVEQEVGWIAHGDVTPLLAAFPALQELRIRGSAGLSFGRDGERVGHARLESLTIESAGLSRDVVVAILEGEFPKLRHLELWLGSEAHGSTASLDDFGPLFAGERFPSLESLAIKNAETADVLATAIAQAPILARLKKLDLSLGTLSDAGAELLAESPAVRQLHDLDLRKSFLSPEMVKRLHGLTPVIVDVRGTRFGKEEEARPSTVPPRRKPIELPLARLRNARSR